MTQPAAPLPNLILASSSQFRRAQLNERLGLGCTCIDPNIDESPKAGENAKEIAARLSTEKAQAVLSHIDKPGIIIAGDQTAEADEHQLSKPETIEQAAHQLSRISGKKVTFYSGVCVLNSETQELKTEVIETHVWLKPLSQSQITGYITRDQPLGCLGAFKNECLGITLFERVASSDPSALTGLPLIALTRMLDCTGFDVLSTPSSLPN